jgi:septal ring factor EnvC (AmiA/AmiB activator)
MQKSLGVLSVALVAAPLAAATPTYTNEDLERIAPLRAQTGVSMRPAVAAPKAAPGPRATLPTAGTEAHWRREAERVRARIRTLREKADEIQSKIDERRRRPPATSRRGIQAPVDTTALERRVARIDETIRELEQDLEERARRARALPGWLR